MKIVEDTMNRKQIHYIDERVMVENCIMNMFSESFREKPSTEDVSLLQLKRGSVVTFAKTDVITEVWQERRSFGGDHMAWQHKILNETITQREMRKLWHTTKRGWYWIEQ